MLRNTFCHIPRVGVKTETRFWEAGVRTWDDMLALDQDQCRELRVPVTATVRDTIAESERALDQGDAGHFAERLPANQAWRLYETFQDQAAYLDIETTGVGRGLDYVTSIALHGGGRTRWYVHGRNLEQFLDDILEFKLLVTFNGRCFDVPFLEREFRTRFPMAHLDLRFALRAAGVTGGLKKCEKHFGLDRGSLDGVDGYWAVLLWREYEATGDERFLETLVAYNIEDVLSLEVLAAHAFNMLVDQTPFAGDYRVDPPHVAENPVSAHWSVIEAVRAKYFSGQGRCGWA